MNACQSCWVSAAHCEIGPVPVCGWCFGVKDFTRLKKYLMLELEPDFTTMCKLARVG